MKKIVRSLSAGPRWWLMVCGLLCSSILLAQDVKPEMADVMRSNGKIYVVITVLGIVLSVFLIYLFFIDSKVKKLEEKMSKRK